MIRPARPDEAGAVRQLAQDAYGHYVARMSKPPGPMLDDYARRIADGQAWVLEDEGRLAGVLVLEDAEGGALLLDNVAVAPSAQGRGQRAEGTGGRWWRSPRKRRAAAGTAWCGSTRTC